MWRGGWVGGWVGGEKSEGRGLPPLAAAHAESPLPRLTPASPLPPLRVCSVIFFSLVLFSAPLEPTLAALSLTPLYAAVLVGAAQNIFSKSSKYSLFDPCKEMAYIPLDDETKVGGAGGGGKVVCVWGGCLQGGGGARAPVTPPPPPPPPRARM